MNYKEKKGKNLNEKDSGEYIKYSVELLQKYKIRKIR